LEVSVSAAGPLWWQIGAWSDPDNLEGVLSKIRSTYGEAVEVRDDPIRDGLTRVRVRWTGPPPADPGAELRGLGFDAVTPVPGSGAVRIQGANGAAVTASGEVVIEPAGDWPVAVGTRRYRGRLLARAVGSETLLINQINLESYLRGVVPVEMGPSQFPELNALKAQAVAARTYAVAHLGDHADEGWDLCDTPACQVYGGFDAEHRLSDRAVQETSGLIAVYEGQPIDAMYTSTCGGHTEDARELFESRDQPYLKGVPCAWDRPLQLTGIGGNGRWLDRTAFSSEVGSALLGLGAGASPAEVLARVGERTGRPAAIPAVLDADSFALALLEAAGVAPQIGLVPATGGLDRLLFLADLYLVPLDPPTDGLSTDWAPAAALAVLELRGDVERDRGEAVPYPGGTGIFPRRARHAEGLPDTVPLWERWQDGYRSRQRASVGPGTVLERIRSGGRVVALVYQSSGGGSEADRRSAWREWIRDKSWSEIESLLGVGRVERLSVSRRSASGRVVGLTAVAPDGAVTSWIGFDVREALELPETLFSMHLRSTAAGSKSVRFLGRGWGHGVGLCQHGAYGLARAGLDFEGILGHYYTGIDIVRWRGSKE
jgi:stage II sporulation protein D